MTDKPENTSEPDVGETPERQLIEILRTPMSIEERREIHERTTQPKKKPVD